MSAMRLSVHLDKSGLKRRMEMDRKKTNTLLVIASAGLIVAGIIFLLIAIFVNKSNWVLASALFCVALSNIFNIIRNQFNKEK